MQVSAAARQTGLALALPFHSLPAPSRRRSLFRGSKAVFDFEVPRRVSEAVVVSSVNGASLEKRLLRTGLRVRTVCLLQRSENRLVTVLGFKEVNKPARSRSFARRYDRDEADDDGEFSDEEPDIASLKTGFAKKFPGKDPPDFLFDFDSDDEDAAAADGRVTSPGRRANDFSRNRKVERPGPRAEDFSRDGKFARPGRRADDFSGDGRVARPGRRAEEISRDGEVARPGRQADNFPRSGRPREEATGYERRNAGALAKSQGYTGRTGARAGLEPSNYKISGSQGEQTVGSEGGSWRKGREENFERRRRSSAEGFRERESPVRRLKDDDRNIRTRGNLGVRKAKVASKTVTRGRAPYGGGEWSKDTPVFEIVEKKKKKPVIEPVKFTTDLKDSPHVAILGGGMSGLACALTLEGHGIQSTVFDTGQHGLGGRMGTRYVEVQNGARLGFDHAAQFFTVTDTRFQKLVDRWISEGAVKEWSGEVGTLEAGGRYSELPEATRYVGTNGMRSLADHMVSQSRQISVKRPCWISRMMAADGCWKLSENRNPQGEFDIVVIAHNGKCANRLLSTARVPSVARQMKKLALSSIWALLGAFEKPLLLPEGKSLDGAFVNGVDSLSWMGNNTNKLGLLGGKSPQCWTFLSTAAYGREHKVPQEGIPIPKAQRVKRDMLHGVEVALGLSEGSLPEPIYSRLQLWGAALPVNTPGVPCIFDALGRVGVCGDWLLGSSLEAAALSGMSLADHIAEYRDFGNEKMAEEFNLGLQESFAAVTGHDIGQFPGTGELETSPSEALAIA